ncbi:hypothetical protein BJ508DRAFT_346472 [Ascobolus immersus RN42]|uniref:Uncharacterized protein n=1 Tax=Ascobolus immersus RN42 TaxID=1160509 RepID=A0A3N4IKL2_ASCIM|nr:hypothetical protein BJ508DRAFT_346472 [Ascobolus immersus RN42]
MLLILYFFTLILPFISIFGLLNAVPSLCQESTRIELEKKLSKHDSRYTQAIFPYPALPLVSFSHVGSFTTPTMFDAGLARLEKNYFVILQVYKLNTITPNAPPKITKEVNALREARGIDHAAILVGSISPYLHTFSAGYLPTSNSQFTQYDLRIVNSWHPEPQCEAFAQKKAAARPNGVFLHHNRLEYFISTSSPFALQSAPGRELLWLGLTSTAPEGLRDIAQRHHQHWLVKELGLGTLEINGGVWSLTTEAKSGAGGLGIGGVVVSDALDDTDRIVVLPVEEV